MKKIYFIGATRTAIGKFGGSLRKFNAADLGTVSAQETLRRSGLSTERIQAVWFGCGRQAGVGPNVARQIAYRAGVPVTAPASTINMACASSLETVITAARAMHSGDIDVALVGGTESMTNVPHMIFDARWGIALGQSKLVDAMYHDGFHCKLCDMLMGATADKLTALKGVTRQEQDEYALMSQQRCRQAQADGAFAAEITPVTIKSRSGETLFDTDEHPRGDATLEGLAKLNPVFGADGTVTAGNACGITDAASSMIIATEDAVNNHGLTPEAELLGYAQSGVEPDIMGLGPVPAVRALLDAQKIALHDIDLVELNEAFAGQVLACHRDLNFDLERLNVHGGAIALGHPIAATGARILTTLIHALKRRDKELGLATLCVSGGQGTAMLLRRV
ncbi:MAG TPA: thiolase family protein [candidate division Zixibacteria bacterium]|nr:thiolase family protein [candidate division Zixibacteria bacterium]